jgi:nicotinamide-nucleotide amidase
MRSEIIAVGSEMLTPDHIDTNSLFITEKLNERGCMVHIKTVVGDIEGDIISILESALKRSDLILLSGGLGPTEDDLTRSAVAKVLGRALGIDSGLLAALKERFASRGYKMPGINARQAELIEGAEVLENRFGTAPGMWIEDRGRFIVLLPGPPRELKPMIENLVMPKVERLSKGKQLAKRTLHITGMTESEVDSKAAPIYTACPSIQTTILASPGHITLRLQKQLDEGDGCEDLDSLVGRLIEVLGNAVFSTAGESLEKVVGRMLEERRLTLAVAESCTSGMIGSRITRVPGSSRYFLGGILCYSNEAKSALCAVPEALIVSAGAVSAEVAESLAVGVRAALKSSIGLSITGIAGPDGGSEEKPVGLVYVAISNGARSVHHRRIIPGDRETIRERATYFALSGLRRFMLDEP